MCDEPFVRNSNRAADIGSVKQGSPSRGHEYKSSVDFAIYHVLYHIDCAVELLNKTKLVRTVSPGLLSFLHIETKLISPHVPVNSKKLSTMTTRSFKVIQSVRSRMFG